MDKESMNKQTRAIMFNALGRDFMLINIIATFSNLVTLTLISTGNIAILPLSVGIVATLIFALIAGLAQLVFLFNFFYSMYYGKKAEQNPWKSNTLEWTAPVEHMHGNWPGKIPQVFRWAYDYSKPGKEEDFVPQSVPIAKGEKITEH